MPTTLIRYYKDSSAKVHVFFAAILCSSNDAETQAVGNACNVAS